MKFRTPLKTAKGLGSGKAGTNHFIQQRVTAIGLVVFALYFMCTLISMLGFSDYHDAVNSLSSPFNVTMLVLFLIFGFYHSALGLQVVIEDYVSHEKRRLLFVILMKVFIAFCAVGSVISALKIAFS